MMDQGSPWRSGHHTPSFTDAPMGRAICLICQKPITLEEFLNEACAGPISAEVPAPASA